VVQALYLPGAANDAARAVAGNVEAMETALGFADASAPIDAEVIDAVHRALLSGTRDAHIAGQVRNRQNWIGGDAMSPRNAEFVPPPEDRVPALMDDLCAFMNRADLPPILQAAIAHAQFETIHPYPDGNGRVGRALIHLVLRRRGAAPRFVPPVSLVLATNADRYVRGLTSFREGNLGDWLTLFARTVVTASVRSEALAQDLADLQDAWRVASGSPRRDSAAEKLIRMLPARPLVDAKSAQAITGASDEATRKALNALEAAGILVPLEPARRHGRWWEAPAVLGLLDDFEWDLATPTRSEAPRRPAPRREITDRSGKP
jgi:Fic family protein